MTATMDDAADAALAELPQELQDKITAACITPAVVSVIAERVRQQAVEGFSTAHDDGHAHGELAEAAACYAAFGAANDAKRKALATVCPAGAWPWAPRWWKPKDRRSDLVRAAALLIAEIERLDRLGRRP
jgi:hypothetical protein